MNFFGHAVAARWDSEEPAFVLGAMLPDFAAMCRGRLAAVDHPRLAEGTAHHHAADAAFHRLPEFLRLCRDTERRLRARGVGRGGARGAAHVGVELVLDGVLVDDPAAARAYRAAVARAHPDDLGQHIEWRDPATADRFAWLQARLAERGTPTGYRDLDVVAARIERILAHRPLLALGTRETDAVRADLHRLRDEVATEAPALLDRLYDALGSRRRPTSHRA